MGRRKRKSAAASMRERRAAADRPRIIAGNVLILCLIVAFLQGALIMAGWWAWALWASA